MEAIGSTCRYKNNQPDQPGSFLSQRAVLHTHCGQFCFSFQMSKIQEGLNPCRTICKRCTVINKISSISSSHSLSQHNTIPPGRRLPFKDFLILGRDWKQTLKYPFWWWTQTYQRSVAHKALRRVLECLAARSATQEPFWTEMCLVLFLVGVQIMHTPWDKNWYRGPCEAWFEGIPKTEQTKRLCQSFHPPTNKLGLGNTSGKS